MHHDARNYLFDVCDAADAILAFTSGVDFVGYAASPLIHSAVERKFEIIGEALKRLSKANRDAFADFVGAGSGDALDIGCGEGRISRELKALGYKVTAADAVA